MKKTAIFTSHADNQALLLKDFFSGGNRIAIDSIFTDTLPEEGGPLPSDIDIIYYPTAEWMEMPAQIAQATKERDIELIIANGLESLEPHIEEWSALLPEKLLIFSRSNDELCHALMFREGILSEVINPEPYSETFLPRAIVAAIDTPAIAPPPLTHDIPAPLTPEEEWSRVLGIPPVPPAFQEEAAQTPPPVPPATPQTQPESQTPPSQISAPKLSEADNLTEPMPDTYLLWSVLAIIFCCFIPAIVALIFSTQVSSRYYAGDLEGSKKASEKAQIWIIISIVAGIISSTLYLPLMMLGW